MSPVGVLKLIYEEEGEPIAVHGQAVGVFPEQREGMEQQVVEVHRVGRLERRTQFGVHLGGDGHQPVKAGVGGELRGHYLAVLGTGDDALDRFGREVLGRVSLSAEQTPNER